MIELESDMIVSGIQGITNPLCSRWPHNSMVINKGGLLPTCLRHLQNPYDQQTAFDEPANDFTGDHDMMKRE